MRRFIGISRKSLIKRFLHMERALSKQQAACHCHDRLDTPHDEGAQALSPAADLTQLLESLGETLYSLPGVDGCGIYLVNEAGDALVTAHLKLSENFAGVEKAYRGFSHPISQPEVGVHVFSRGEAVIVTEENHADFGDITRRRFKNMNMRSLAVVPISSGPPDARVVIGVAAIFSHRCDLDPRLVEEASSIALRSTSQIHALWLRRQALEWGKAVKDMYAEIQQHIAFITELNSVVSVKRIYALIGKRFMRRFNFDVVAILMAEGDELAFAHVDFEDEFVHLREPYQRFAAATRCRLSPPDAACSVVFANNQRFVFDDVQQVAHLPMAEKDRASLDLMGSLRTSLLIPLRLNGTPIGILWLGTLKAPHVLSDSDLALIELLTSYVSTAIRNAEAHELVESQKDRIELLNQELQSKIVLLDCVAKKDRLTGLHNYGSFEEELKRRTGEIQHTGTGQLSAIILDVDHFKLFNDTYGHPAGNQVLQEFANRVLKSVRDVDFVARYGGEEFVVLLPECDMDGAARIAERIRTEVGRTPIAVDGIEHWVSVSGGCAEFSRFERPSDFVQRVDAALYAAKQNGRDRIETAPSAPDSEEKTVA